LSGRRAWRGFPFAGTALAAVAFGHWLTYLMAVPEAHAREELLAHTGHAYWPVLVELAVALALAGFGTAVLRRVTRRESLPERGTEAVLWIASRLAVLQLATFGSIEVAERLIAGTPVGGVVHGGIIAWGVATQTLLAAGGALLLLWLGRAGDRAREILATTLPPMLPTVAVRHLAAVAAPQRPLLRRFDVRGPPSG
jgi:hypothetical protein